MSNPLALDNLGATGLVFGPLVGSVLAENRRFGGDLRRRYSDRTYWQLQAWQLAGLVSAVLLAKGVPGATLPGSPWLWVVLGCAVGLAGVTLRWWAIRTLGKQFTRNMQVGSDHARRSRAIPVRTPSLVHRRDLDARRRRLRARECAESRGLSCTSRDRLHPAHLSGGGAPAARARRAVCRVREPETPPSTRRVLRDRPCESRWSAADAALQKRCETDRARCCSCPCDPNVEICRNFAMAPGGVEPPPADSRFSAEPDRQRSTETDWRSQAVSDTDG